MKIASIRIKNLRAFRDVTVPFTDYTSLVGANGSGKSTILCALNIFFREIENATTDLTRLVEEDFHRKTISEPIEITVTFDNLSKEAQQDFHEYYRQGVLIVTAIATFDKLAGFAEVKQYGQRLGFAPFKEFFKAVGDKKKVGELKPLFGLLTKRFPELSGAKETQDGMIERLRDYEGRHPNELEVIPSEDEFYGVSKGANRLARYIQWVYIPAVKDASTEQAEAKNTALGKLLSRTVRSKVNFDQEVEVLREETREKYEQLLQKSQGTLDALSGSLQKRLREWAHPTAKLKLNWGFDAVKSVKVDDPFAKVIAGEGGFEGELTRLGHGFQRSYLIALLQELATLGDTGAPKLILGCEEPELYQHPPQARHLSNVFQKLAQGSAQIVVSTHSPYFVSGEAFEDVRLVRYDEASQTSHVALTTYAKVAADMATALGNQPDKPTAVLAKMHQALQPALSEMFFSSRLILVEGLEDLAYLSSYLHLMEKWDEFRRTGCHIVAANGKSELLRPLVVAKHLSINTYFLFDADGDKPDRSGSKAKHQIDNLALLKFAAQPSPEAFPQSDIWGKGFTAWASDVGAVVAADIGSDWETYKNAASTKYGHAGGLGKNTLFIASALETAWKNGKKSANLQRVCEAVMDTANRV